MFFQKRKMISKGLFVARRPIGNYLQKRGIAVANWKRPTMDEHPKPTKPWAEAAAARNRIANMRLAAGVAFLISALCFTDAWDWASGKGNTDAGIAKKQKAKAAAAAAAEE